MVTVAAALQLALVWPAGVTVIDGIAAEQSFVTAYVIPVAFNSVAVGKLAPTAMLHISAPATVSRLFVVASQHKITAGDKLLTVAL